MIHCNTIEERVHMVSLMVAQPTHGLVSQLSHTYQVSRPSLYRWRDTGVRALEEALGHQMMTKKQPGSLQTLVLTLLIETHASYRGIQTCLKNLHGIDVSLGTIASILKEAGQPFWSCPTAFPHMIPLAVCLHASIPNNLKRVF